MIDHNSGSIDNVAAGDPLYTLTQSNLKYAEEGMTVVA